MPQLHQGRPAGQQSTAQPRSETLAAIPRREPGKFGNRLCCRERDAPPTSYPPNSTACDATFLFGEPIEKVWMLESLLWMV
jgi:hypothetical protein